MNRWTAVLHELWCRALQRKMQLLVTPALAVLVVVNAVDNACLHRGVVVGQADTGYSGN